MSAKVTFAQVPTINYTTPQVYTVGTAITTLSPTSSGVGANGSYATSTNFGSTYSNPEAIAYDGSGNIYVTNISNNTVRKFNSAGTFISTIGTGLNQPYGISFDASDNAYITNYGTNSIIKVTSAGVQSTFITGLSNPFGTDVDASGNLYVTNFGGTAVQKYSSAGTLLSSISVTGSIDVDIDGSGNIYILSYTNGTVTKYDPAGTLLSTLTPNVSGLGVTGAFGLTVDASGNIYIADSGNNRVLEYDSSNTLVANISTGGTSTPRGTTVDASGNVYVTLNGTSKVKKYVPTGGYSINQPLPAGLTFNSSTGAISGTPTAVSASTSYIITAFNTNGSASKTINLTIYPVAPTAAAVAKCGAGSVTMTASGGSPSGGTYNWYRASTGGTALQSTTSTTYSPSVAATSTYYVSYTSSGLESARTPVTATINPIVSSPMSGAIFSYPFNNSYVDISGNANNGYSTAAPATTTDRYGASNSAYNFNGSTQFITADGADPTAAVGINTFTMSLWFNTTTTSGGKLIGFGGSQTGISGTYDRHLYMANSGQLYFGLYPNYVQTINTTASYNDGNWHHAVVTVGPGGSTIYVDGVSQASSASMTTGQAFSGWWRIGADNLNAWTNQPSSNYFNGKIDDVAIYNRVLSSTEIAASNDLNQIGSVTTPLCVGSAITFNAPAITGATYSWQDAAGTVVTGQNPTFTSAVSGSYTLTVTGGPGSCSSTSIITPTFNASPSSTFTATASVVVGANATITYTGTDPATSTYAWTFTGGTPSTGTGQGPFSVKWAASGTKTVSLAITNAGGCQSTSTQTVNVSNTTYGNYAFSRVITLNNSSAGISSTLTNFPVLLSIQNNDLKITGTCADKVFIPNGANYDFAFIDPSSATELYYQIESYNQTTGTLLVWVQVPSVSPTVNNTLTFYYGSQAPTVTHNTAFFAKTWPSDYQVVYHFNDAYTGTVTADGTANNRTASLTGFQSTDLVANGKIGQAYNFGGNNNMTAVQAPATTAFTLSAWVNITTGSQDQKILTTEGASGLSSGGYKLGVYTNNVPETENFGSINRGSPYPNSPLPTPATPAITPGTWYYVQGVYNGSTLSTYINGVQYGVLSSTGNVTLQTTLYIGIGEGGQYPFNGKIDEPRVSNIAKTSDWLKMEYYDQNNPVSFTSVSSTATTNVPNGAVLQGALTYTWTGATSTDPSVAGNWDNTTAGTTNQLPAFTGTTTLVVPSGLTNYPTLTADISVYGLTLASGAAFNLNGHVLSVGCNIYNSSTGTIKWNNNKTSAITWNGSLATQTYTGSTTTATAQIGSMTVNNSAAGTVTLGGGPVDLYNQLTITKGNLVISASPAALTLKSTATLTASVNTIISPYTITGTVSAERYITGGSTVYRGYRLISSPVYAGTVSGNNVLNLDFITGSTLVTGAAASSGFDKVGNPSIYLYREDQAYSNTSFTSGNFWGVSKVNNSPTYNLNFNQLPATYNIPVGNGIFFFFRGDRTTNLANKYTPGTSAESVTMTSTGTLNQGPVTVKNWFTPSSSNLSYSAISGNTGVRGFNLVGNPYASSINWDTYNTTTPTSGIYAANVSNTIYVLDPVSKNYGAYMSGAGVGTQNATATIASGQGFFVLAKTAAAVLTFNESAKTTTQVTGFNLLLGKPADVANVQYLRLQLSKDSIQNDDLLIRFNNNASTEYVINEDAPYRRGLGAVSLCSISSNNIDLAINNMPLPKSSERVGLDVNTLADGTYALNMTQIQGISNLYDIWLMDAYKKDSLDMRHNPTYSFNVIKSDSTSFGAKRFSLVIRQNPAYAYHLLGFTASKIANVIQVQIVWKAENEANYTHFSVERSTDGGKTYEVIGSQAASGQGTYSMVDKTPASGQNLYRLKQEDLNGTITYSPITTVMYSDKSIIALTGKLNVYPNPATSVINLAIADNISSGNYKISITNSSGLVIKEAAAAQNNWQTAISNFLPGTYVIQVVNKADNSLIGQTKFVKM